MYVCMYAHIYIYICMYVHTDTYRCTYMHAYIILIYIYIFYPFISALGCGRLYVFPDRRHCKKELLNTARNQIDNSELRFGVVFGL